MDSFLAGRKKAAQQKQPQKTWFKTFYRNYASFTRCKTRRCVCVCGWIRNQNPKYFSRVGAESECTCLERLFFPNRFTNNHFAVPGNDHHRSMHIFNAFEKGSCTLVREELFSHAIKLEQTVSFLIDKSLADTRLRTPATKSILIMTIASRLKRHTITQNVLLKRINWALTTWFHSNRTSRCIGYSAF